MHICCMQTLHRQISGDSPVEQSIKLVLDACKRYTVKFQAIHQSSSRSSLFLTIIPADPTLTLSINIAQKPHILGPLGPKALIYIYIYIYIYYMRVLKVRVRVKASRDLLLFL